MKTSFSPGSINQSIPPGGKEPQKAKRVKGKIMAELWEKYTKETIVRHERYRFMFSMVFDIYEIRDNSRPEGDPLHTTLECWITQEDCAIKFFTCGVEGSYGFDSFVELTRKLAPVYAHEYIERFCDYDVAEEEAMCRWMMDHNDYTLLDLLEDSIQE